MSCTQPKILVFTVTAWNSKVGANTWETLLEQYDSKNIANICIRDEIPDSDICSRYFAISESKILKSVLNRKVKTGREIMEREATVNSNEIVLEHNQRYAKYKQKRLHSMLLAREIIWKVGKWKTNELNAFLDDFKPNIILYSMEGYIHLNRIVEYAIKRTNAKAIGYIWDDNFTYKQSKEIGYKIYRYFQRKSLKKLAKKTDAFFAITPKTKKEADAFFGIDCAVLSKPLNAAPAAESYESMHTPLKMLYTGNLLIGRDKTLEKISLALKEVNRDASKIVLNVYTQTALTDEYLQEIQHEFCRIYPPIAQTDVLRLQKDADVLLFLEDLSAENLKARLSFSTKITDYFSTGKCIFAVGNGDLAPMQYFSDTNSALVVNNEEEIRTCLEQLLEPQVLAEFAQNAVRCGVENHSAEYILKTFDDVLMRVYKGE